MEKINTDKTTLHDMWADFYAHEAALAKKCRVAAEESKKVKKFRNKDYVIICTTTTLYAQHGIGTMSIKERFTLCEIDLWKADMSDRLLHKVVIGDYEEREEVFVQANQIFKEISNPKMN